MAQPVRVIGLFFILALLAWALFLALVPFVLIWALNVLFSLNIHYTLVTWFAALIILLILGWHKAIPVYSITRNSSN